MKLFSLIELMIKIIVVMLPWRLKRLILIKIFKYEIAKDSYIGLSWVFPEMLVMKQQARIGHFNYFKPLECVHIGFSSSIGSLNLINGFPRSEDHYVSANRELMLKMGNHSAITNQHIIDCTDTVSIGCFVTVAGYRSQILSHAINLKDCIQECKPVVIGDYSFIGTNVVLLPGASVPSKSVVAACSVVREGLSEFNCLYGGIPAVKIKEYDDSVRYFQREVGSIK